MSPLSHIKSVTSIELFTVKRLRVSNLLTGYIGRYINFVYYYYQYRSDT